MQASILHSMAPLNTQKRYDHYPSSSAHAQVPAEESDEARRISESKDPKSSLACHPRASSTTGSTQHTKRRYYQQNLSEEDRAALSSGELNHNLREWDYNDLLKYHASRIDTVPYTDKRQSTIAAILKEKRESEQWVSSWKQRERRFVRPLLTLFKAKTDSETHRLQMNDEASQSMKDPTLQESYLSPDVEPQNDHSTEHHSYHRVLNTPYQSPEVPGSSPSSGRDRVSHVGAESDEESDEQPQGSRPNEPFRAHASHERPYTVKADVTFDTFLVPHVSGKGETYRSAQSTQQNEPRGSVRRPRKVLSMPQLKKRASNIFGFGHKD